MNALRIPVPLQALLCASLGALTASLAVQTFQAAGEMEQPVLWWAGRATGFVAYAALWASVMFGMAISSRGAGGLLPKKVVMDLHQQWTLSAVVATLVHVATLVLHEESGVTPLAVIVPFASERLTGPVAIGTVAFLGLAIVAVSSWLRKYVPYGAWRAVHGFAFGTMLLSLVHGWTAGTDTVAPGAQWLYIVTAALLIGALVTRVGLALTPKQR